MNDGLSGRIELTARRTSVHTSARDSRLETEAKKSRQAGTWSARTRSEPGEPAFAAFGQFMNS